MNVVIGSMAMASTQQFFTVFLLVVVGESWGEVTSEDPQSQKSINTFLKQFSTASPDELNLIVADNSPITFKNSEIPASFFELKALLRTLESSDAEECPVYVPFGNISEPSHPHSVHKRSVNPLPNYFNARNLAFVVDNEQSVVDIFTLIERSKLNCSQKLDVGPFHADSLILLISSSFELLQRALSSEPLKNHPRALGFFHGRNGVVVLQHPFQGEPMHLEMTYTWNPEMRVDNVHQLLPPFPTFHGQTLIGGASSVLTFGSNEGFLPRRAWPPNTYGLLFKIFEKLNATLAMYGVSIVDSSTTDAQGNYQGQTNLLMSNFVDLTADTLGYRENQVLQLFPTELFGRTFYTFAAPKPRPLPKSLAFILPFHVEVWLALLFTLTSVSLAIMAFMQDMELPLSKMAVSSFWFTLTTLLRQDFRLNAKPIGQLALSMKWFLVVWSMCCLVIISGYSGSVRSFLINPGFEAQIDSLDDVFNSDLAWKWYRSKPLTEAIVAQSTEKEMQRLWQHQQPILPSHNWTLNQSLKGVMDGKYVLIGTYLEMAIVADVAYTRSNGETLVHVHQDPIEADTAGMVTLVFPKVNRWAATIRRAVQQMIDMGLMERLKRENNNLFKQWYSRIGQLRNLDDVTNSNYNMLTFGLDEMQAIFLVALFLGLLAFGIFVMELII